MDSAQSTNTVSILKVLASIVHQNKYMMAAGLVTHLRGLLDETITWCNERKQFGLHLREFTLVQNIK